MCRSVLPTMAVAVAVVVSWGGAGAAAEWSRYAVETTVAVSEPASRRADLASYRVRATLDVTATRDATDDDATLLAFRFQEMQVLVRGAGAGADYEARPSPWEGRQETVYAAWGGRGARLLHDRALPALLVDYARALVSLFQVSATGGAEGGEHNETDAVGECLVLYEPISADVFRKVKRRCEHDAPPAVEARRVARYTRAPAPAPAHRLAAILADEVVTVRVADLALKARSLHMLTLLESVPPPPPPPPSPPPAHYVQAALAMPPRDLADPDDDLTVEEAVREFGAALEGQEAGGGGSVEGVAALVRLVSVLQGAPLEALAALLRADTGADRLAALCGALGLAGTAAAAAAVRRADLPEPAARAYLAGLGGALAPHPAAVADALALAEEARATRPALADAALLAAAAASARAPDPALAARLRDRIARTLTRCKDEACRRVAVAALGNTRAAEVAETLVAHAEGGGGGALAALALLPRLQPHHLERVAGVARNASRALEERAAALELVAERETRGAALPLRTAAVWRALHAERGAAAGELRRLLAQRLAALAERREAARRLLAALPPELRGWDAPPGASTVLVRRPGWAAAGWHVVLDSRQVAERAVLRRGRVALEARADADPEAAPAPLLAVELWTRGLSALTGADDAVDGETMAAGLGLAVAGASLPDVDLFEGQGELVGHIWAGTGSEDTRVVRAAWPVAAWRRAVPLAGGVTLHVRAGAALAAALDARVSVSLWQRAARGALVLRAAAAARLALRLASPTGAGAVAVEARSGAAPRLRIHSDLDFYDGVTLCVRAATAAHEETRAARAEGPLGARGRPVARGRDWRVARAGRTLSLGRENDVACRTLRSADDDDDDNH